LNDDEIIVRAESAARLLSDPLMKEAFDQVEAACLEALVECRKEDDAGRYRLSEGIKACRLVKRILSQQIESGQVAASQIQELKTGKRPWSIVR
jgi:hypothetical protein